MIEKVKLSKIKRQTRRLIRNIRAYCYDKSNDPNMNQCTWMRLFALAQDLEKVEELNETKQM